MTIAADLVLTADRAWRTRGLEVHACGALCLWEEARIGPTDSWPGTSKGIIDSLEAGWSGTGASVVRRSLHRSGSKITHLCGQCPCHL